MVAIWVPKRPGQNFDFQKNNVNSDLAFFYHLESCLRGRGHSIYGLIFISTFMFCLELCLLKDMRIGFHNSGAWHFVGILKIV